MRLSILAATALVSVMSIAAFARTSPPLRAPIAAPITAATPPMGWNPYNAFDLAYSEADVIAQAELMVSLGLAGLGYRYVNVDDGWWLRRDDGTIAVRTSMYPSARMPDGRTSLRPFVDRLHKMGLKAGIYTDIGRNACSQRWRPGARNLPEGTVLQREIGAYGHHGADAALLFSDWGFDFVKIDACGAADFGPEVEEVKRGQFRAFPKLIIREQPEVSDARALAREYASFAQAAKRASRTGGPVISICAWGQADVNDWGHRYGQMWRTSFDINPTWKAMLFNFDSAASRALFAGPGRWNDPDMLEVGNGEFDDRHLVAARAHMSLWAVIAAPLILGNDLRRASPAMLDVIRNRAVIAINQDPASNQGVVISRDGNAQVLAKALTGRGRKAVALVNRGDAPLTVSATLADIGLAAAGLRVRDVWTGRPVATDGGRLTARLAPRETMLLLVEGRPAEPGVIRPADIPARFDVADVGYKAPDRSPERQWVLAQIGYRPYGAPLLYAGRHDRNGLGVTAGSSVRVRLNREFSRVTLDPRVENGMGRYAIRGDGRLLASGQATTSGRPITVTVRGVREIELVAPAATKALTEFAWHDVRFVR